MTESKLDALERLCVENLDGLDFQVSMTTDRTRKTWGGSVEPVQAATEVLVDYVGEPTEIHEVVDQHGEVVLNNYESRSYIGGEVETSADLVVEPDASDPWTGSGATGGRSGGSSSPATPGSSESDDDSDDTSHDASGGVTGEGPHQPFPDPSKEMSEEPGGIRHVLAADDGGEDSHVCGTPLDEADYEGSIRDLYDDLMGAIADPMLCDTCEDVMCGYYNIPKDKVHEERQERHG